MAPFKPTDLKSQIARAYGRHYLAVRDEMQPRALGYIELELLDGLESYAAAKPSAKASAHYKELLDLLDGGQLVSSEEQRAAFKDTYFKARALAFPASTALIEHEAALKDWTASFSLIRIDTRRLRLLEAAAQTDPVFESYVKAIAARFGDVVKAPNTTAYRQVFERYSEALVLQFLRGRNVLTSRVEEIEGVSTPDFQCELDDGRQFFVEVKSFDVVGGDIRQDQMSVDAIDGAVELQAQREAGAVIATSINEFAPYRTSDKKAPYDHASLAMVINALKEKYVQAFKAAQFARGPTFALGAVDRLMLPAGANDLAPYHPDHDATSQCISGVLWHAAYGRPGTPVFRPAIAGHANLEGHLAGAGFMVDQGRPFPGVGAIALERVSQGDRAWGLIAPTQPDNGWDSDTTAAALAAICDGFNDEGNAWL